MKNKTQLTLWTITMLLFSIIFVNAVLLLSNPKLLDLYFLNNTTEEITAYGIFILVIFPIILALLGYSFFLLTYKNKKINWTNTICVGILIFFAIMFLIFTYYGIFTNHLTLLPSFYYVNGSTKVYNIETYCYFFIIYLGGSICILIASCFNMSSYFKN